MLCYDKILKVSRSLTKRDPEDIAQSVWITLSEAGETDPSWKMIRWRCLDQLRKRPFLLSALTVDVAEEPVTERIEYTEDVDLLVREALLTDQEQMLLYYKVVLGLDHSATGREMKMSRLKVSVLFRDILERLRGVSEHE